MFSFLFRYRVAQKDLDLYCLFTSIRSGFPATERSNQVSHPLWVTLYLKLRNLPLIEKNVGKVLKNVLNEKFIFWLFDIQNKGLL